MSSFAAVLALAMVGALAAPASGLAGTIEGSVIDAVSKVGIEQVEVCAYEVPATEFQACEETDSAGEYTLSGLPAASFKVAFWGNFNGLNYLSQFYADKPSFELADEIAVAADATVADVDAEMHEGGQIEGSVIDAVSKAGIANLWACAVEVPEFEAEGCGLTNASGGYAIGGLPTGSYIVEFEGSSEGLDYQTRYFDGKSSFWQGDEVSVMVGATTPDIDAELPLGARIEGRVTDAFSGAAIEDVGVCALGMTSLGPCALTNANGEYALRGLASDSYVIEFWAEDLGYPVEFYDDKSSFALANPVSVTAPATVTGIDGHLGETTGGTVPPLLPVTPSSATRKVVPASNRLPRPRCRKGFRKIKKHGRKVCVRAKKHRREHSPKRAKQPRP